MTAPELSEDEKRIVDRFDAAPDLPESWAGQQRMAAGYAQARDRLADQERRQLVERLEALATELEAPVFRAAVYVSEEDTGRMYGEDAERLRVAARIRAALDGKP